MQSLRRILGTVSCLMMFVCITLAQHECDNIGANIIATAVDSSGIVHQVECWSPSTQQLTFPLTPASPSAVTSVFGRTGAVTAGNNDYSSVLNLDLGDGVGSLNFVDITSPLTETTTWADGVGDSIVVNGQSGGSNNSIILTDTSTDSIALGNGDGFLAKDSLGDSFELDGIGDATVFGNRTAVLEDDSGDNFALVTGSGTAALTATSGINFSITSGSFTVADPNGSVWNTATGGAKGLGTINARGLFVNGTSVLTSVPVSSVFGRTGAVVAATNDYSIGQINGLGSGVATALGNAANATGGITTTTVNFSISGGTVVLGSVGGSSGSISMKGTSSGSVSFGCTPVTTCTSLGFQLALQAPAYQSSTNCSGVGTSASPSVVSCSAAPAGAFSCATNASGGICTVNTTIVTTNSDIVVSATNGAGTRLGVTCNNTADIPTLPRIGNIVNGTSFAVNLGTFTTNPECFFFHIMN
jgi:hypothetical protein